MSDRAPARIEWAVEQLGARASDEILEIGCGGGFAVALLAPRLARGRIVGIDRSALQAQNARSRNRAMIEAGRVEIAKLSLDDAPPVLGRGRFHRVLAINVNVFWTDPVPAFEAVRALLRPRGLVYLVYEPPTKAGIPRVRDRVCAAVEENEGFSVGTIRNARLGQTHAIGIEVIRGLSSTLKTRRT